MRSQSSTAYAVLFCCLFHVIDNNFNSCNNLYMDNYISISRTKSMKAILSILVFVAHLARFSPYYSFPRINLFGEMAVAGFYFLSGYGLSISLSSKQNKLLKDFFVRIIKLIIPLILSAFLYLYFDGEFYLLWFSRQLLFLYATFYMAIWKTRKINGDTLLYTLLAYFIGMVLVFIFALGNQFAVSSQGFIMGVIWYMYGNKIKNTKIFNAIGLLSILLIAILIIPDYESKTVMLIIRNVFSVLFVIAMVFFMQSNILNCKFMVWLGNYSYGIILVQLLIFELFIPDNPIVYTLGIVVITILSGIVFQMITNTITNGLMNLFGNKKV